jgi:metal-sulfur cluster biosynthetic enzyme
MVDEDEITEALSNVIDPELGLDFVELGLIYGVEVNGGNVEVTFTLTTPACPIGPQVSEQIVEFVSELEGVDGVTPTMTFTPPCRPRLLTRPARAQAPTPAVGAAHVGDHRQRRSRVRSHPAATRGGQAHQQEPERARRSGLPRAAEDAPAGDDRRARGAARPARPGLAAVAHRDRVVAAEHAAVQAAGRG